MLSHTTTRDEGDFAIDAEPTGLAARRRAVVDHPWVWLRQVHGADVVVVTAGNAVEVTGSEADALVTTEPNLVLAVQTADCVPITFASRTGVIAVAHAGWRGLEAGVVERTLDAMRALGAESIVATIGPHIQAECYEFGAADLDRLAVRFGDEVRSTTNAGAPALDLTKIVVGRLQASAVSHGWTHACTACEGDRWFSYRARAESERLATVIWREPSYESAMVDG